MAKKKPVKKIIAPKPSVRISTSARDNRDKPPKLSKASMLSKVKGKLRESAKKEAEIKASRAKRAKAKQQRNAKTKKVGDMLGKSLKIANPNKNKKITGLSAPPKKIQKGIRYKAPTTTRKSKYKNQYIDDLAVLKKKRLRAPDKKELERVKKNLQNIKYRTIATLKQNIGTLKKKGKKLKKVAITKKQQNRLYKKEIDVSVAIEKINKRLGIGRAPEKVGKRKTSVKKEKQKVKVRRKGKKTLEKEVTKIIKKEVVPIWEGRGKLTDLLKTKLFTEYVVNGRSYTRQQQPELFLEFSKIEIRVRAQGVSTPHIIFYQRITDKICEISEYNY